MIVSISLIMMLLSLAHSKSRSSRDSYENYSSSYSNSIIGEYSEDSPWTSSESASEELNDQNFTTYDRNAQPILIRPRVGAGFSYDLNDPNGPLNWGSIHPNCDGNRQSPININPLSFPLESCSSKVTIEGIDKKPASIIALNNGHSYVLKFTYADGKPARFLGGPLKDPYIIDGVHWHWGEKDTKGSEHTFAGRYYSAEGHFVSFNSKYGTLANAITQPDGLAVLGIFYERVFLSKTKNPFIKFIPNVIAAQSSYTETDPSKLFTLRDLVRKDKHTVLSYPGSLTTPNCFETVTWMVSINIEKISVAELAQFRSIKDDSGHPILTNFRPLQKLNSRKLAVCAG